MSFDLSRGGLFELGVAKLEDLDVLVGGKSLVKLVDLLLDSLLHLLRTGVFSLRSPFFMKQVGWFRRSNSIAR